MSVNAKALIAVVRMHVNVYAWLECVTDALFTQSALRKTKRKMFAFFRCRHQGANLCTNFFTNETRPFK